VIPDVEKARDALRATGNHIDGAREAIVEAGVAHEDDEDPDDTRARLFRALCSIQWLEGAIQDALIALGEYTARGAGATDKAAE
jgi:hypothetical protein